MAYDVFLSQGAKMKSRILGIVVFATIFSVAALIAQTTAGQSSLATSNSTSIQASVLNAVEAAKIMPPTVFFRGQSASIQGRNSAGIRFAGDRLMLVSLVDTSGYSSQVREKYQAYLMTESALDVDGHHLALGAYGCGFISGDSFVVMDIGGHDLFTAHSTHDVDLHRPTPLQILAAPTTPGEYRLYIGRNYVSFHLAAAR
jgi:hypothetical protein